MLSIRRGMPPAGAYCRSWGAEVWRADSWFQASKKDGPVIVIPAENGQKQKLYVAVVCEGRVFSSTDVEMIWGEWREPNNIFESRIVVDVCSFIWNKLNHPVASRGFSVPGKQKANKRKYLLNFVISC